MGRYVLCAPGTCQSASLISHCRGLARSGLNLNIIRGCAEGHSCAFQGERSKVDQVSMSDEPINEGMCIEAPALRIGVLKSPLAALPRLEIGSLFPAHGALLSLISGPNATTDNFEIASKCILAALQSRRFLARLNDKNRSSRDRQTRGPLLASQVVILHPTDRSEKPCSADAQP